MRKFVSGFLVIVSAVLALTLAPPGARPASAIAHGEDVADGAYRFTVLLTMTGLPAEGEGTRNSSCSGALIAPRWVITAGHCFRDEDGQRVSRTTAKRTTATIGRADLTGHDGHEVEVVEVHQADTGDVALAQLKTAVTDIEPLRLGTTPPAAGSVVRLTGYGLTDSGESAITKRLQTGQFTVDRVGDSLLETSGRTPRPETSPCRHDSGGPYFRRGPDRSAELVAVVSGGPGCPHPGPDFSARTDNLGDWITGTISDDGLGVSVPKIGLGAAGLAALAAAFAAALAVRRHARAN